MRALEDKGYKYENLQTCMQTNLPGYPNILKENLLMKNEFIKNNFTKISSKNLESNLFWSKN